MADILGTKWDDRNGNGVRDSGEPGLAGVTIYIDLNGNRVLDPGEPQDVTNTIGQYAFTGLEPGTYTVREVLPRSTTQTFPSGPPGTNNPPEGNVTPTELNLRLTPGRTTTETVSLSFAPGDALFTDVDVFLLLDDTGSFSDVGPVVASQFPGIIEDLQESLPDINFGFGVGRFEDYGGTIGSEISGDNINTRPFILNQPIITTDTPGFNEAIEAALERETDGGGGDGPETLIESLFQIATGEGFDGNGNGNNLDSGLAGLFETQDAPGDSGDVPPFLSFTEDPENNILSPSGSLGGAGFRPGALPIILAATDVGTAYRDDGTDPIVGVGDITVALSEFTDGSRAETPDVDGDGEEDGASIQDAITALNSLGALVIGLGTEEDPEDDPREPLEALAILTGAVNNSEVSIENGIADDPIDPGDPLYFQISSDPEAGEDIAQGIATAVEAGVTSISFEIDLVPSEPEVELVNLTGSQTAAPGETVSFEVEFTGTENGNLFDLLFAPGGTTFGLGSIPVSITNPFGGGGQQVMLEEEDSVVTGVDFGNQNDRAFRVVARTDSAASLENTSVLINVLANDFDPNGDPILLMSFTEPNNGTVTRDDRGTPEDMTDDRLRYIPNPDFFGRDRFTYEIEDSMGNRDIAAVNVRVISRSGVPTPPPPTPTPTPPTPTPGTPIQGTTSNDNLSGTDGQDTILGLGGNDAIDGGENNDFLLGGQGNDTIRGDDGDDTLSGDIDRDVLIGGDGEDRFVLITETAANSVSQADRIEDFTIGSDAIALTGGLTESQLTLEAAGSDTVIRIEGRLNSFLGVVVEVSPAQLSGNFITL